MNKKGEGTAFGWFLGLLSLLVLGTLFIVFNQALSSYVRPVFDDIRDSLPLINSSQRSDITQEQDNYMFMWNLLPFIIFFVVIIWVIVNAVKKSREDMQG